MGDSSGTPVRPPPPVPKPRTKLPFPNARELDDGLALVPSSSTASSPAVSPNRVPPPRPPPPRIHQPISPLVPRLPALPLRSPEPPAIPPRADGKVPYPAREVPSYPIPHTVSEQRVSTSSTSDSVHDQISDLPKHPPPLGWNIGKHKLSLDDNEDPLQPLIDLPNGRIIESRTMPAIPTVKPLSALLPDRPDFENPAIPRPRSHRQMTMSPIESVDSTDSSHSSSGNLSSFSAAPPPVPVPRIEYVENPVYLNLSNFRKIAGYSEQGSSGNTITTVTHPIVSSTNIAPQPQYPLPVPLSEKPVVVGNIHPSIIPVTVMTPPDTNAENSPIKLPVAPVILPPNNLFMPSPDSPPPPEAPPRSPLPQRHQIHGMPLSPPLVPRGPAPPPPLRRESVEPPEPKESLYPEIPFRQSESTVGIEQSYAGDAFNTDSFMFTSVDVADVDEVEEDIIELVQSENEDDADCSIADGSAICFSGFAEYQCSKKDKKTVHVRLRDKKIAVYEDEESEEPLAGPYDLPKAEFVGKQTDTNSIVCRFIPSDRRDSKGKLSKEKDKESQKELKFTPVDQLESWMLILAECWLGTFEGLRACVSKGMTCCGRMWLRQGATSKWTHAAAFLYNLQMYYIVCENAETTYELDLRKVVTIKSKLDSSESCPMAKKKEKVKDKGSGSGGPFLITVDSGSLCIECDDAVSSVLWLRSLEFTLSKQGNTLEECRLCIDDVPVLVDKCIKFVAAYGLSQEGIYRRNGKITEAKEIMKQLLQDPVDYFLTKETDETVFAVADVLRQFLRRLDAPLFPVQYHEELFEIYKSDASVTEKTESFQKVFKKFPVVNYSTIRRLIDHLREISQNSAVNKASNDNVAKIFGPTVFNVEGNEEVFDHQYKDTSSQIGVLVHLITEYENVFQMTHREAITKAQLDLAAANGRQKARAAGFLTAIHMWEKDNRPFNVQSELVADEVCRQAVSVRGFDAPPDSRYAIFEVLRNGALVRRLLSSEKLSTMVLTRWIDWNCPEAYFLFDHDNNPYDDKDINMFSGKVKVAEPGSKTFKSGEFRIENGTKVALYRNCKLVHHWDVDDTIWYTGAEANRKAPYSFSLTFLHKPATTSLEKCAGFCVSFKMAIERNQFSNTIHFAQTRGEPPLLVHL